MKRNFCRCQSREQSPVLARLSDGDRAANWGNAVNGLVNAAIGARAADVFTLPDGAHLPRLKFLRVHMKTFS